MKLQTHLKLFAREHIENWKYIDTIIFLILLLIYMGYTDPCDRCAVNFGYGEQTCKEAFMTRIGYEEGYGNTWVKTEPKIPIINLSQDT
jgi:hypothetical protein